MKTIKHLLVAILTMLFIACSSDDDNSTPTPTITYLETGTTIEAVFFREGETETPTLEHFPQEEGTDVTYSLDDEGEATENFQINVETGQITWTKFLEIGENTPFTVIASAGEEELHLDMVINNPNTRTFEGTYEYNGENVPFTVTLQTGGILTIDEGFDNSISDQTWNIPPMEKDLIITFQTDVDGNGSDDSITFSQTAYENNTISGTWRVGETNQGAFEVILVTEE